VRFLLVLLLAAAGPLAAQGSPFVPLDHPLLPLAEYLIARGDVADPSPMIRPFRRADLIRAIEAAQLDPASPSGRIAASLRAAWSDPADPNWVRVAPRAGLDAFTSARRDLLHPAGDDGARFYADLALEGRFGPLVLVSRPAAENRLKGDPDWAGAGLQRRKSQAYRFVEGYLAAQFEHARLFFGQMDRNWGPVGALGLSVANAAYPRTDLGLSVVFRDLQFDVVAAGLTPMKASDGSIPDRLFLAHRLNVRVTRRLDLALWETGVLTGSAESPDLAFTNPMVLLSFPIQLGRADDRNAIIGGDLSWRIPGGIRVQGQAMIDDRWRRKADPQGTGEPAHPGRWALSGVLAGPLGGGAAWRASLGVISSLAYRTIDSTESFLDRGLGIGPTFPDQVTAGAAVQIPVRGRWLVTPDVVLLTQGEGRLDAPFPTGAALTATPELFLGRKATTLRLGATVSGGTERFQVDATGGYHHTTTADHVAGRTRTRFEGRLRVTVGLSRQGAIR